MASVLVESAMLPVSQQDLSTAPGPAVLRSSNHKASGVSTDGQHPGPASIHSHYSAPIPPPPFSKVQRAAASHGHRDVASAATSIVSLTSNTVCTGAFKAAIRLRPAYVPHCTPVVEEARFFRCSGHVMLLARLPYLLEL